MHGCTFHAPEFGRMNFLAVAFVYLKAAFERREKKFKDIFKDVLSIVR